MPASNAKTRVLFVQPTLAKYRVPVYRELASRPEIDLRLWYGDHAGIKNAEPEGFCGELKPIRAHRVVGQEVLWHSAQLEAVDRKDVDVVVLSWGSRYLSLGRALRRAKRRGVPILLWGHGYAKKENWLSLWARNRLAKLATVLMFYDEPTAAAAVESGWPADRVFVAPNAIDQTPIIAARDVFLSGDSALQQFREKEGLVGRKVFFFISRFTSERRLDRLVEAMDELRQRCPEALAVLVGGGEEFENIERMIADRDLSDHVRLIGPVYGEEALAPWFLSAEAFVCPSAIGLALLHAFGYSLPVITDDAIGGHGPEIVAFEPTGPDQNGLFYKAGDTSSLAEAMESLLGDDELREKLSRNAQLTIERKYNVTAMVDGMVRAIERCAELGCP